MFVGFVNLVLILTIKNLENYIIDQMLIKAVV